MRAFLAALVLLVGVLPGATAAQLRVEADAAYWGEAGARREASPGDTSRVLTVEVRNSGATPLAGLDVALDLPSGFKPSYDDADRATTGYLAAGAVWPARFVLDIPQDLRPGESVTLRGTVTARPVDNASTGEVGRRESDAFEVPLAVTGRGALLLDVDPEELPAHDVAKVTFRLENRGDAPLGTVRAEVTNAPGSALRVRAPLGPVDLDDVPAGGNATFEAALVTPDVPGAGTVLVDVHYADATGATVSFVREVPFLVHDPGPPPLHVTLDETRLKAGRTQVLHVRVHNGGLERAGALDATLVAVAGIAPVNASNVQALPDLGPGDNATFVVPVVVSATARGAADLRVALAWRDTDGARHSEVYDLGVEVEGAIEVLASESCARYDVGTRELVVRGVVTNVGNTDAHDADVTVAGESDELGDLAANEPVSFGLRVPASAAPTAPVRANATWSDDLGRRDATTFDVPLVGEDAPSRCLDRPLAGDRGIPAPGIAVAVALAAALRRRR